MLRHATQLLDGAQWGDLSAVLGPALFATMPPGAVASTTSAVLAGRLDGRGLQLARDQRARLLRAHGLPVSLAAGVRPGLPADLDGRRARGEAVLRLYFHQVLAGETAFLDLGADRFSGSAPLRWDPGWPRHRWRPGFRAALADLYAGFYQDDGERFDRALVPLGIGPARDLFLAHFGAGDQSAVRFSVPDFRDTFLAAFVACRDGGSRLHPDFLPLGAMLTSMYTHLQALDLALDVRRAWTDTAAAVTAAA